VQKAQNAILNWDVIMVADVGPKSEGVFSGLHEVGHFIRSGIHVFKTTKPM
jgi:hypothetical protein